MLSKSMHLIAYRFSGYWKDVGTIASLWECNMDLLDRPEELNLIDRNWRIYSRNPIKPSNFISEDATVSMSAMTDGCQVYGTVQHSVLSDSVTVEKGAVVIDSVLLPGVTVQSGAYLDKCIVGFGTIIGPNVKAGASVSGESPYINTRICSEGIVVIEKGLKIKENAIIPANSQVDCDIKTNESENVIEETFRV